jgi:hypothetical protein
MESPADLRLMIEQTLTMIITPDQQLIEKGQTQLQALELLDTYTLALTEITVDTTRDISIRQLAGVLLRKYVSKHWTRDNDNFIEPEVPEQVCRYIGEINACMVNVALYLREILIEFRRCISND